MGHRLNYSFKGGRSYIKWKDPEKLLNLGDLKVDSLEIHVTEEVIQKPHLKKLVGPNLKSLHLYNAKIEDEAVKLLESNLFVCIRLNKHVNKYIHIVSSSTDTLSLRGNYSEPP